MCVCTVYKIHQSLYHQFSLAAVTSRVCYHPGSTNLKSSKYQSMTSHRDLQRIDVLLVSTCRSRLMSFRPCQNLLKYQTLFSFLQANKQVCTPPAKFLQPHVFSFVRVLGRLWREWQQAGGCNPDITLTGITAGDFGMAEALYTLMATSCPVLGGL